MADTSRHWRIVPSAFLCNCGDSGGVQAHEPSGRSLHGSQPPFRDANVQLSDSGRRVETRKERNWNSWVSLLLFPNLLTQVAFVADLANLMELCFQPIDVTFFGLQMTLEQLP